MQLKPIDRASADLDAWSELLASGMTAESGSGLSGPALAARIRAEGSDADVRRWAATVDGTVVGAAQSTPDREARFVRLFVSPAHQGRGVGTALLNVVRSADPGSVLKGIAVAGGSGERFAMRRGATVLMRLVVLEQRLVDVRPPHGVVSIGPAAPTTDAMSPDRTRIVCWTDGAPEELLDSYAAAYNSLSDAPDSHHQLDGERYDGARIRRWEREIRASGHELWVCAAVECEPDENEIIGRSAVSPHDGVVADAGTNAVGSYGGAGGSYGGAGGSYGAATGRYGGAAGSHGGAGGSHGAAEGRRGSGGSGVVVAFTEVEVGPEAAGSQHSTVVLPSHRRRGLGAVVKRSLAARLRALRPDIVTITTTVNAANAPMIALNRSVGYTPVRTRLLLELRPPR